MQQTSQAYKDAIVKSTRASQAKIYFGIYDVTAKDDAAPSANGQQYFTDVNSIRDNVRVPEFRMGTFENEGLHLGGNYHFTPDDVSSNDTLGWWSEQQSNKDGLFEHNMVENVDFAIGTAGWTANNASLGANAGTLTVTGNGAHAQPLTDHITTWKLVAGRKIYLRAYMNLSNSAAQKMVIYARDSATATTFADLILTQNTPVQDQWYLLSGIGTVPQNVTGNLWIRAYHQYADATTASGKVLELRAPIAVDLTAIFGAGNEPTKEWCDANIRVNTFKVPTLTILFDTVHSSAGLGLFFDSLSNTYCKTFEVTWYNGSTVLLKKSYYNEKVAAFNLEGAVENYNKIEIKFFSTNKPYSYVKLLEVNYGIEQEFTSDNIISANVLEEVDPSSGVLSINTLKFTLLNKDQQFNMLNPTGIYAYLQKRQLILAFSSLLLPDGIYEDVPMGTFYLSDWKNSTGITASLEATDIIGLLDKTTYYSSSFWTNEPLSNVIAHILNDAGNIPYSIGAELNGEVVNGYIPIMSHREALQHVLLVSRAILRVDRDGILRIIRPDYNTIATTIDYNTIIGSPTIEQKPLVSSVNVKEHSYKLNGVSEQLHESTFTLNGTSTLVIPYDEPAANPELTITGSGSVVGSVVYSATSAKVTINGTGSLTVKIMGQKYTDSTRIITSSLPLTAGEVAQAVDIADNTLISGTGKAKAVADYILDYFKKRITQKFDYWDDPSVQAGDCVNVATMFGSNKSGLIERHEIEIAPALRGRLEVTG